VRINETTRYGDATEELRLNFGLLGSQIRARLNSVLRTSLNQIW